MASFISTLSLFLLVLANGYLTLPINNEQFQTSTMLSSNVDVTSERPLIPRELLMDQVEKTTESLMELQMTTSTDNLAESASHETRTLKEMTPLSSWMLTTVESTTEDDNDITTEDNPTMESQSEPKNDKREASVELTTNTLPLTSTNSIVNSELTTEESSKSKPSKKFTGLLKDKKDGEKDLEHKEKDDEDQKLVKPSKTDKKEDDKEKSDDEDKIKPSKTHKKEKEDDKEKSDDEDKVKSNKTYKKEKEDDKAKSDDEDKEKSSKKHKNEKEDDKEKSDEDSKKTAAPIAQLDLEGMKNVSNYQKEYMDLDENSTFTVTQSGSTDSTTTLKYNKGKKPLNEGEESATVKEEESNQ